MTLVVVSGVSLDVCKPCRAVWFDRGELGLIARRHGDALHQRVSALAVAGAPVVSDSRFSASDTFSSLDPIDLFHLAPDAILLAGEGARVAGTLAVEGTKAAANNAGAAADLAAAAGEAALEAGDAGAELAASAAEVLLELLAGIFS